MPCLRHPCAALAGVLLLLGSACADDNRELGANNTPASGSAAAGSVSGTGGVASTAGSAGQLGGGAGASSPIMGGSAGAPPPAAGGNAGSAPPITPGTGGTISAGGTAGSVEGPAGGVSGAAGVSGTAGAAGAVSVEPAVDPTAPLTAVAFFPSKDRTNTCADAAVSIQFNRPPLIKAGGKIQILEASGAVFDSVTASPRDGLYYSALTTRTSGGKSFRTDVLDIVYNTVVFHPKAALAYGKTYQVTVDEGMITDELGTKFAVTTSDSWTFTVRAQAPTDSGTYSMAADGSADYCSIEGVLKALPATASAPRMVQVGPGVYPGIVRMNHGQVHFLGAGMDKSIFAHKNSATMNDSREGIVTTGSNVTFEALTIFNTYLKDSNGQQAEALYVTENSAKVYLKNVHLRSHQDTLRVDGSAYMEGGKISGSTDPLWGYGAFYCDGCELASRTSGHAFVVTRSTKGFGLVNCSVTKESDAVSSTYLAQYHDGSEPGKIAFVKCQMDTHIKGWRRAENNQWYEHQNTNLQTGAPLEFDGRQLTTGSAELTNLSSAQSWLGWSP